jgi:hypothetical protein
VTDGFHQLMVRELSDPTPALDVVRQATSET